MNAFDYVVIGGGVAGLTAAETIREFDPQGSLAIVSREAHPLYSRVLLPRFVNGEIRREQLFLRAADDYRAKRIELIAGVEAQAMDAAARRIRLADGEEIVFRKLIIASGGRPRPLGMPGAALAGVSRFHTIEDAEEIRALAANAARALVVGGGFIALEYLDALARRGVPTTLLLSGTHALARFLDAAGGAFRINAGHGRRN